MVNPASIPQVRDFELEVISQSGASSELQFIQELSFGLCKYVLNVFLEIFINFSLVLLGLIGFRFIELGFFSRKL